MAKRRMILTSGAAGGGSELDLTGTNPVLNFTGSDQAADEQLWTIGLNTKNLNISTRNDADSSGVVAISIIRGTGTAVTSINTLAPVNVMGVGITGVQLHVVSTGTTDPRGIVSAQHSTGVDGARFSFMKSRGTEGTPTTVVSGDALGKLFARGYDSANYLAMASIEFLSTGTIAATRVPTQILFRTATDALPSVLITALTLGADQIATFASSVGMTGLKLGTGTPSSTRILDSVHTLTSQIFWTFVNTNAGTGAGTAIRVGNADTSATSVLIRANGTGYTTSGANLQDGGAVIAGSNLSGGLVVGTEGTNTLQFSTNTILRLILAGDGLSLNPVTSDSVKLGESTKLYAQVAATNVLVGAAAVGTSGANVVAMINGTVPSTSPADSVQLFSVDLSAGNASLGIRTETAVVTETVVSDRTLSVTVNGTIYKICLKV